MNPDHSSDEDELHDINWDEYEEVFDYNDPYSLSVQIKATAQNDVSRLKTLIQSGKSVNINDNKGNTPLMIAIIQNSKEAFDYLLTVKDIRFNVENYYLDTPLLLSLRKEDTYYARKLLEHGADPNNFYRLESTYLHYVLSELNQTPALCEEYCCMLLVYGADPHIRDGSGNIPFNLCLNLELPLLQQVLFNYTFEDVKKDWDLKTFLTAMKHNSPYLDLLLNRNYELYYEDDIIHDFHSCIFSQFKASPILRLILKYEEFSEKLFSFWTESLPFLVNSLLINYQIHEICKEKLQFLYELSHTKYLASIIEAVNETPRNENIVNVTLSEEESMKLFFVYLTLGYEPIEDDIEKVYLLYGPEKFFKLLLHFKAKIGDYNSLKNIAKLYYNLYFVKETLFENLTHQQHSLFSKFFIKAQSVNGKYKVPSLLELARNEAREFLIERYQIKDNVQFYTILQWLPINNMVKEYLSYMKPVYNNICL